MCDQPSPIINKFNGVMSIDNDEFFDITYKNLALRGSILKNTNFIIGIVLYVGNDTKAHMNSKKRKRKQSWLLVRMHQFIKRLFLVIAAIVLVMSVGGLIFDSVNSNWPDNFAREVSTIMLEIFFTKLLFHLF